MACALNGKPTHSPGLEEGHSWVLGIFGMKGDASLSWTAAVSVRWWATWGQGGIHRGWSGQCGILQHSCAAVWIHGVGMFAYGKGMGSECWGVRRVQALESAPNRL